MSGKGTKVKGISTKPAVVEQEQESNIDGRVYQALVNEFFDKLNYRRVAPVKKFVHAELVRGCQIFSELRGKTPTRVPNGDFFTLDKLQNHTSEDTLDILIIQYGLQGKTTEQVHKALVGKPIEKAVPNKESAMVECLTRIANLSPRYQADIQAMTGLVL